jgi:hypothetical protein
VNLGKHSFECFAPGGIWVFLRRVPRLGPFDFSRRYGVGRSYFLRNHRNTIHVYEGSKL